MTTTGWSRRRALGAMAAAGAASAMHPFLGQAQGPPALLFRDVLLVDGSGAPGVRTDVLVRGQRIEHVGRMSTASVAGARVIEGGGRVLAPGFVDMHTHGNPLVDSYTGFLAMGVTTVVVGQDGTSPRIPDESGADSGVPAWLDALERSGPDINVATVSGHGSVRRQAGIGDDIRRPADADLARMVAVLEADLRAGSFGLSTGLEYVPGVYAETRELSVLGDVLAARDAVVISHMRSEDDDRIFESIEELIEISLPARPHVSHLKVVYGRGEALAEQVLAFLHDKRGGGMELTADAYPYTASYTGIGILFPEWALPPTDYAQVLATRRDELRDYLERRMIRRGGPESLLFGTAPHVGKTLAQVSAEAGLAFPDMLLELGPRGGSAAHFVMDEALHSRLLLDPIVAIATDGGPSLRHPRSAGTFAKWIEQYVVQQKRVTLEEAIRKATSLPASICRIPDRGVVRPGAWADLVLFEPADVRARADFTDPLAHAEGFDLVVANGTPVFEAGERIAVAGRVLRS